MSLISVLETCYRVGVTDITVYAFSIENFNRSKEEVDTLMGLLRDKLKYLALYDDSYARVNKVKIKIIGNRSMIPGDILKDLEKVEEITNIESATRVLNVCFPYTSRDDIVHSIQNVCNNGVPRSPSVRPSFTRTCTWAQKPQLDLLIRTSGHTRLSDFMLWQCTHDCKIEFVNTLWPDFKFISVYSILLKWSYYHRQEMKAKSEQESQESSGYSGKVVDITSFLHLLSPQWDPSRCNHICVQSILIV
ncbi:di-trans,poly-cis-decaprenylcistransferase [Candidozyma auris]|nr:di-trans,poly-cis-decaprenylcistransferase [[Candida] auris]